MNSNSITCIEDIKNIFYINLEHRIDRKEHVEKQLENIGFHGYQRFNAIKKDNGAIGCSMSHLNLLQQALTNNLDHILIVEDDILFMDPDLFKIQLNTFLQTRNGTNDWDVILFAGNNMAPYQKIDDTCVKVLRCQTTTGYLVNGHYITKLFNNVKKGLTNLIKEPNNHSLYAIDKHWFQLQESDNWFLITPLTVVQREDYSDIEKKVINYYDCMIDLDKTELFEKLRIYKEQQKKQQLERQKYEEIMSRFKNK
jgi:glycosyl transferase family 25